MDALPLSPYLSPPSPSPFDPDCFSFSSSPLSSPCSPFSSDMASSPNELWVDPFRNCEDEAPSPSSTENWGSSPSGATFSDFVDHIHPSVDSTPFVAPLQENPFAPPAQDYYQPQQQQQPQQSPLTQDPLPIELPFGVKMEEKNMGQVSPPPPPFPISPLSSALEPSSLSSGSGDDVQMEDEGKRGQCGKTSSGSDRKRKRSPGATTDASVTKPSSSSSSSLVLLSHEQLRNISSAEYSSFVDSVKAKHNLSPADKKEIQRQKRLIRNREYAQKKRKTNKEKTQLVHQQLETQEDKIEALQTENSYLKSELFRLKSILTCLLPKEQHHVLESPVLPLVNPQKRRRQDSPQQPTTPTTALMLVVLFSVGLFFSATVLMPSCDTTFRGAGRVLLSETTSVFPSFFSSQEEEENLSSVSQPNASELKSRDLRKKDPLSTTTTTTTEDQQQSDQPPLTDELDFLLESQITLCEMQNITRWIDIQPTEI